MDFLKKLGMKGQMGVMVVVMVLVGVVGFKAFPNLEKQGKEIDAKKITLAGLEEDIAKGESLLAKLPELKRKIAGLEAKLEELKLIMPPDREDSKLLGKFQKIASRSRVSITRISPGRPVRKEFYDEYPLTLDVTASYHDLGLFFSRVAELSRIINVNQVNMRAKVKANNSNSLTAKFKAVTFIYREDDPADKAASKKGKKKGKKKKEKK